MVEGSAYELEPGHVFNALSLTGCSCGAMPHPGQSLRRWYDLHILDVRDKKRRTPGG